MSCYVGHGFYSPDSNNTTFSATFDRMARALQAWGTPGKCLAANGDLLHHSDDFIVLIAGNSNAIGGIGRTYMTTNDDFRVPIAELRGMLDKTFKSSFDRMPRALQAWGAANKSLAPIPDLVGSVL